MVAGRGHHRVVLPQARHRRLRRRPTARGRRPLRRCAGCGRQLQHRRSAAGSRPSPPTAAAAAAASPTRTMTATALRLPPRRAPRVAAEARGTRGGAARRRPPARGAPQLPPQPQRRWRRRQSAAVRWACPPSPLSPCPHACCGATRTRAWRWGAAAARRSRAPCWRRFRRTSRSCGRSSRSTPSRATAPTRCTCAPASGAACLTTAASWLRRCRAQRRGGRAPPTSSAARPCWASCRRRAATTCASRPKWRSCCIPRRSSPEPWTRRPETGTATSRRSAPLAPWPRRWLTRATWGARAPSRWCASPTRRARPSPPAAPAVSCTTRLQPAALLA